MPFPGGQELGDRGRKCRDEKRERIRFLMAEEAQLDLLLEEHDAARKLVDEMREQVRAVAAAPKADILTAFFGDESEDDLKAHTPLRARSKEVRP